MGRAKVAGQPLTLELGGDERGPGAGGEDLSEVPSTGPLNEPGAGAAPCRTRHRPSMGCAPGGASNKVGLEIPGAGNARPGRLSLYLR